jgi:GNAT superfamily N-acetyltransferase
MAALMTDLTLSVATIDDAGAIAGLAERVANRLTSDFGKGPWSTFTTEAAVLRAMEQARYLVGKTGAELVAALRLATKKPWAIDAARFTPANRALYLVDMAVAPERQRRGIGRRLLAEAERAARRWPADAIRLDAYDAPAGAGPFYLKCGWQPCGRVVYRGTPLLYFELLLEGDD